MANWLKNFGFCCNGDLGEDTLGMFTSFFWGVKLYGNFLVYYWGVTWVFDAVYIAVVVNFCCICWSLTFYEFFIVSVFVGWLSFGVSDISFKMILISVVGGWWRTILLILSSFLLPSFTFLLSNNLLDSSINASNLSELGTIISFSLSTFSIFALTTLIFVYVFVFVVSGYIVNGWISEFDCIFESTLGYLNFSGVRFLTFALQ